MKKSLARVLSLALVLVLLVGAMPFALASDPEELEDSTYTVNVIAAPAAFDVGDTVTFTASISPQPEQDVTYAWGGVASGTDSTATYQATTTDAGTTVNATVSVTIDGKTYNGTGSATVYAVPTGVVAIAGDREVEKGKNLQLRAAVEPAEANPALTWESSNPGIATVDNTGLVTGVAEGSTTVTAKSLADKDKSVSFDVTVKPAKYAATMQDVAMKVGEAGKSVTVAFDPALGELQESVRIAYTSSDPSVVTVNEAGSLTALKKGEVTITATITGVELSNSAPLTCKVTVTDGAVIDCANQETLYGNTVTLVPTLKVDGKALNAEFTFTLVKDTNVTKNDTGKTLSLKKTDTGMVEVLVSVKSYTGSDGNPASATEVAAVSPKTVYVSFYDVLDAEVTVKSGVGSFMFDDSNVFSGYSIDKVEQKYPQNLALTYVWAGVDYYSVNLSQKDSTSTIGKVTYTNSTLYPFNPLIVNNYSLAQLPYLKFTCLKEGKFVLQYELLGKNDLCVRTGSITINTNNGSEDIVYKTNYNASVILDEDDFAAYWKASKLSGDLDYVIFDVNSVVPYYGELYTTNSTSTRKEVTNAMKFSYKASTSDPYDLDLVTFVPNSIKKTSYTEEIPFTCYGTKSGDTLAGVMVIEVSGDLPFTDVKTTDWFFEDVSYVYNNDIMNGTSATTFDPNATLTRAMVVTMLYRIEGEPFVSYSSSFKDVPSGQWYTDAVAWAAKNDIVNGFDASTFGPSRAITREQLAAILYRYADYKGQSTSGSASLSKFYDSSKVSSYAEDAMEWAVYEGIINGDAGYLKPAGTATRAEAAAMFHRYLEG